MRCRVLRISLGAAGVAAAQIGEITRSQVSALPMKKSICSSETGPHRALFAARIAGRLRNDARKSAGECSAM